MGQIDMQTNEDNVENEGRRTLSMGFVRGVDEELRHMWENGIRP